jgi:hypothetical protein
MIILLIHIDLMILHACYTLHATHLHTLRCSIFSIKYTYNSQTCLLLAVSDYLPNAERSFKCYITNFRKT